MENSTATTAPITPPEVVIIPPTFKGRVKNDYGLINGINYVFNDDGTVNWRKMIKPEHLVLNRSRKDEMEKEYGKSLSELTPAEVDDKYLLILLAGLKELAFLRGYHSIEFRNDCCSENFIAKTCEILWSDNYETFERNVRTQSCGDASKTNTFSWYANYLSTAAENRAFARCVRNFLRIYIVGYDEVGPEVKYEQPTSIQSSTAENPTSPSAILTSLLEAKKLSFDDFKAMMVKAGTFEGAADWKEIKDVPKAKMFEIIGELKNG